MINLLQFFDLRHRPVSIIYVACFFVNFNLHAPSACLHATLIFWNLTHINIPHPQLCVHFRKLLKMCSITSPNCRVFLGSLFCLDLCTVLMFNHFCSYMTQVVQVVFCTVCWLLFTVFSIFAVL